MARGSRGHAESTHVTLIGRQATPDAARQKEGSNMIGGDERDFEVVCPTCKERLVVSPKTAKRGAVRCSRGHEIKLARMMDSPENSPGRR